LFQIGSLDVKTYRRNERVRVSAGRRLVELGMRLAGELSSHDHEPAARLASSSCQ